MLEERWLAQRILLLRPSQPVSLCRGCYVDRYIRLRGDLFRPHLRRSSIHVSQTKNYSTASATVSPFSQFSNRQPGKTFFTGQSLQASSNGSSQSSTTSNVDTATSHLQEKAPVITRARRKQLQRLEEEQAASGQLPLDASSRLSAIASTKPPSSIHRIVTSCLALSKPRLSFLMVLATATSYTLYPTPVSIFPELTSSPLLSALTLVYLTGGTALCCASANSLNMYMEPKYDAQMSRTRNRPLVRGLISNRVALIFAATTALLGVVGLYYGVNPTTAFLGGLNIVLYAGVYTPLKRISPINTWVGAIVGGIPPLMGWAAAAGQSTIGSGSWQELLLGEDNLGGWLLAGLLFAWQFPHFNALSWTIREEYKNAGYKMLCWMNPRRNGRVALRYAILLFPICWGLTYAGVTDTGFLVSSTIVNAWVLAKAIKFWRFEGHKGTARGLFWAGVWQLPLVLGMAMFHKRGFWQSMWERVIGGAEDEEDDDIVYVDDTIPPQQGTEKAGIVS